MVPTIDQAPSPAVMLAPELGFGFASFEELEVGPAVLLVAAHSSEKELALEFELAAALAAEFALASALAPVAAIRPVLEFELEAATRPAPDFALAVAPQLAAQPAYFASDLPKNRLCCEFETAGLAAAEVLAAQLAPAAQVAAPAEFAAEFALASAVAFAPALAEETAPELAELPVAPAQAATLELSCCRYSFKLLVIFTKIYTLILSRNVV